MSGAVTGVLWLALLVAGAVLAYALYERRALRERVRELHSVAPFDDTTGLLSRGAFHQRLSAETRRVDRHNGAVHLWIARAGDSTVAAGQALRNVLHPTELGFRLGDEWLCAVITELDGAPLDGDDMARRITTVAHRGVQAAVWRSYPRDGASAEQLVADAQQQMTGPRGASA